MKQLLVAVITLVLLWPLPAVAERSAGLEISASVLPRPCEYPDRCENVTGESVPAAATRALVSQENISYVGSPPMVEKQDDLLVVKF